MLNFLIVVGVATLTYCAALSLLLAVELLLPRGVPVSLGARLRGVTFALISIPLAVAVYYLLLPISSLLHFPPLIPSLPGGPIVAALVGVCIADFFYYWFHRAQHAVPVLWRFHAIHHSIEELGAASSYQHGPSEEAFKTFLLVGPLLLLIPNPLVGVAGFLVSLQMTYIHTATRINLGPLGYFFTDNRTHRIHHSRDPKHFDHNFGAIVIIWDVLFRTVYFPRRDEWPQTGLTDRPEPRTVAQFLLGPFKKRLGYRA